MYYSIEPLYHQRVFELLEVAMWQHLDRLHELEELIECHCDRQSDRHIWNMEQVHDYKNALGI